MLSSLKLELEMLFDWMMHRVSIVYPMRRSSLSYQGWGAASVAIDDVPTAVGEPTIPSPTPTTQLPPPSQDLPSTSQRRIIASMDADVGVTLKDVADIAKEVAVDAEIEESADVQRRQAESQAQIYQIDLEHVDKVLSIATISTADTPIFAATFTAAAPTLTTALSAARRRKGVVIRDPEKTATTSIIIHSEDKSKDKGKRILVEEPKPLKKQAQIEQDEAYARELEAELNKNINWDDVIDQVQRKEKEDNAVMRYQALKRKPQTKAQAKKNMMIYMRNMAGFKMDYFKGMKYDDIRPIFKKYFNSNVALLEKTKEQMEEEDSRALKRANESQAKKAAKKQKLDEEVAELKRHLQIVPNDKDDVYTEATPLARKETRPGGPTMENHWLSNGPIVAGLKAVEPTELVGGFRLLDPTLVVVQGLRRLSVRGKRTPCGLVGRTRSSHGRTWSKVIMAMDKFATSPIGVTFKRKVVKQTSVGKGKEKVSDGEAALEKKNMAREKGIMVEDDMDFNKKKCVLPRGVTFKRKFVVTKGQKSIRKGKEKVSEGEAALANENKAMKRGNGSWLKMMWVLTRKKHVLPRPNGIVIREGGSLNVGARSKNLLNVGEMLIVWEEIKLLEPVFERSKEMTGEIVGGKKEMNEMSSCAGHVRYITGASLGKKVGVDEQLRLDRRGYDLNLIDEFFLEKWLPRVSVHLKSLSDSHHRLHKGRRSYVLPLLSAYCTYVLQYVHYYALLISDINHPWYL
nr:hypothetical protein [Tanacetum cinerariifolium]